jgi:lipid II:glycine glycyltransferase (peptidoglycan interpeptide bridge formation enzyme)
VRRAGADEIARWDELVRANPDGGHILQSRTWGEFKARHGWEPHHLVCELPGATIAVLALRRRFPVFGDLWYTPKGPGVGNTDQLLELCRRLSELGLNGFLLKVEPELEEDSVDPGRLLEAGLVKAPADVQINRATVWVDLSPDEEVLLGSFKSKTRYNIRLAARKDVQVVDVDASQKNLDEMYRMMAATRDRAGFFLRPRSYYQDYWKLQAEQGQGRLFFARLDGEPLAGAFVTWLGTKAWFKDGGSVRKEQSRMPSYLLQWEIMRWLKARGLTSYDLVGVPPRDEMAPDHSLHSLVQFKTGFSDDIVQYIGTWDLPMSSRYQSWVRWGERAAASINRRLKRDLLW